MTLPALASLDDVAAIIGRPLTSLEQTNGTRLLAMASGMVRRYTRQNITQVLNDTVTVNGSWANTLELPQRPVTRVVSVTVNGATVPTTSWKLNGDKLFFSSGSFQPDYGASLWGGPALWGPAGTVIGPQATGTSFQGPAAVYTIVCDHGFAEVPQDIVNEVAGMVALQLSTSVGVDQEKIGGYSVNYQRGQGGGMALTDETKSVLNFYRRRAASVSIAPMR